jgi:hypothetical protein
MTEEMVIKYLEFLKTECLRYSKDKLVDENDLQLFKLEFTKFKTLLEKSELNQNVKDKIVLIDFNLSEPKFKGFNLIAYLIGNEWSNSHQTEKVMSRKFILISEQLENTIIYIKSTL